MAFRRINRRSHPRMLANGKVTFVRATEYMTPVEDGRSSKAYRHGCPHCGAPMISVHMPNGGWVHFEGRKGLTRTKHSCMHVGEKLGRRRATATPDLFESYGEWSR